MRFKIWLETDVKQWQNKINQVATGRTSPFASWFPADGVVRLPFKTSDGGIDEDIAKHFEDSDYKIHDYKKGLLINKKGQIIRLGKVINKNEADELKSIEADYAQGKMSDIKYKNEIDMNRRYFQGLRSAFEASPYRRGANNESPYVIVITNKPEDIAGMSTNRDWTSCMNLKNGVNKDAIWCELKDGGFVAYLCNFDDTNIDKPLARIHIRRFDNKNGQSICIPEESVYGNEIQGFKRQVQDWIDSKQGRIRPGKYVRKGGWYSDSFGNSDPSESKKKQRKDLIHTVYPKTGKGLFKLLEKYISRHEGTPLNKFYDILGKILEPDVKLDDVTKEKLVALIRKDYHQYLRKLFVKYPELVNPEDFKKMGSYEREAISKDNPNLKNINREIAIQKIMDLDMDNLKTKNAFSDIFRSSEITDTLRLMSHIGQLPQSLIAKVIEFGNQVIEQNGGIKEKELSANVIGTIVHEFNMAHADTPAVINFYRSILPYWDALDGEYGLGSALGGLGANGEPFLPFLKQKLQEKEKIQKHARETERLRYIIDSIENGTGHSNKYSFN